MLHDRPVWNIFLESRKYINNHFISGKVHWSYHPFIILKNTIIFVSLGFYLSCKQYWWYLFSIIYLFISESKWQKEKVFFCPPLPNKKTGPYHVEGWELEKKAFL